MNLLGVSADDPLDLPFDVDFFHVLTFSEEEKYEPKLNVFLKLLEVTYNLAACRELIPRWCIIQEVSLQVFEEGGQSVIL